MTIQFLSVDEVAGRMREVIAKASALQARTSAISSSPANALVGGISKSPSDVSASLDFQSVLKEAVRGVSEAQNTAQSKAQAYQLGDDKVSLEDVMISIQKASLAMQGMVQVRNRLVEAYREVMNMQV